LQVDLLSNPETITVEGIKYSRDCFKGLADKANEGMVFRILKVHEGGPITIEKQERPHNFDESLICNFCRHQKQINEMCEMADEPLSKCHPVEGYEQFEGAMKFIFPTHTPETFVNYLHCLPDDDSRRLFFWKARNSICIDCGRITERCHCLNCE
jgi:hypothetical protein